MTSLRRPCIDCGRLTRNATRCATCARAWHNARDWARGSGSRRGYGYRWAQQSRQLRAQHLELYGSVCPGWARAPHRCSPQALVVDHDLGVMCRSCNAVKAATVDKKRVRVSDGGVTGTPRLAQRPVTHEPPVVA